MLFSHWGELAALGTALCWTFTAIVFEKAAKRVGALPMNLLRLVFGFVIISVFNLFSRGLILPTDAPARAWVWLSVSGLIGFVLGDIFLVKALIAVGARIALLIMTVVPLITTLIGFLLLGETITPLQGVGMLINIAGIAVVVLTRGDAEKKIALSHPAKGLLFALVGAVGQAFGLVVSKYGMGEYHPFAATQIRMIAAIAMFCVLITAAKQWKKVGGAFVDRPALKNISVGAFFGPFLGVSLQLTAVAHTATGVVSTITSISPILIIPFSILLYHERVKPKEILGAVLSIVGVTLLFI